MSAQTFTATIRVRYADCDAQGIVFNARWFELFDVAMTEFWRESIGGYEHLPRSFNIEAVIAETGARFRGAGRFDDLLDVEIAVARVGTSSMRIELDVSKDGQLLAEGFIEYVFVDRQSMQPVPIPDQVKNMLPDRSVGD